MLRVSREGEVLFRLYGTPGDVEVWRYLYQVAHREIQRKASAFRRKGKCSRTEMTKFREGAVVGLQDNLKCCRKEEAAADRGTTAALVLRGRLDRAQTAMEAANPSRGTYQGGIGASAAGVRAGRQIHLTPALE